MCFNVVILNLKGRNDYRELIKTLYDEFNSNKDGIFLYNSLTGDIIREVGTDKEYRWIIDNFNFSTDVNSLIHMHLRLATRGKVNKYNVHGWSYTWNNETFLCSHNGSYHNYLGDNSDSKEFFDRLFVMLNEGMNIEDLIKDFYGVAFCTSTDKILAISYDKSIKLAYLGDSIVLSNESLYEDLSYNAGGYELKVDSPEIYNKMILIDIRKKQVKELYEFTYTGSWLK